jgi:hypothetical protein
MPSITRARCTARPRLAVGLAGAFTAALMAGGCGGGVLGYDGVEMNGGVFDALGLSGSKKEKEKVPKVAARPGLVLPPDETRLPAPGEGAQVAAAPNEAWPLDPEANKAKASAALDQQQKEYCDKALLDQRMKNESGVVSGPKGNCRPGLFGSLSGMFEGEGKGQ